MGYMHQGDMNGIGNQNCYIREKELIHKSIIFAPVIFSKVIVLPASYPNASYPENNK